MRPQLLFRKIHKWLGLILGIQILLWFISGFLMSFMPIDEVRGDHLLKKHEPMPLELNGIDLPKVHSLLNQPIESIVIKNRLSQGFLVVKMIGGKELFLGADLMPIAPLNKSDVTRIIKNQIKGNPEISNIQRLSETPDEARGRKAPLWMVELNDSENSRIYISDQTGEILAKRTDRWRLFDFVWMLHIMDYDEREDFSHPLLYLTAFSAFLFTLTGFMLLFYNFRKKPQKKINNSGNESGLS